MFRILVVLLGLLAAAAGGCCMCAHPYDYCYPTCDGACGGACCEHDGRVLSAFSPRHDPYYDGAIEGEIIDGETAPAPMDEAPQYEPESEPLNPPPRPMPETDGPTAHSGLRGFR